MLVADGVGVNLEASAGAASLEPMTWPLDSLVVPFWEPMYLVEFVRERHLQTNHSNGLELRSTWTAVGLMAVVSQQDYRQNHFESFEPRS